jgi:hypothetical protein
VLHSLKNFIDCIMQIILLAPLHAMNRFFTELLFSAWEKRFKRESEVP